MCGISGIFNFNNNFTYVNSIYLMTCSMRKRGPDDEGYVTFSNNNKMSSYFGPDTPGRMNRVNYKNITDSLKDKTRISMGHRRLSVQDTSSLGHQPMSYDSGRYTIVFNGEIYNYKDIKNKLESIGHAFDSNSDTEVVLASYVEWKEECLKYFNGDFSFSIYDNVKDCLFCARDRIGVKPFYYLLNEKRFVFGSDIKSIIASCLYKPKVNPVGLYLAMAFGMAPRPITAFKDIHALEQSHWMIIYSNGEVKKQKYWNIGSVTQDKSMSKADATYLLDKEIHSSIAYRLVSDVPVGTFMSGGVDSTTISAIASRYKPGIKAFTLGFDTKSLELDEISQAKDTANMCDIEHIISRIDVDSTLKNLQEWVLGYEEPFDGLAANYVISDLVKSNGVKVVLNGLGGDELFGGYGYYKNLNLTKYGAFSGLKNIKNTLPKGKIYTLMALLGCKSPDRLHSALFCKQSDYSLRELFSDSFISDIDTPELLHNLYSKNMEFADDIEAFGYMDLMNYIGNHHVHRSDQFTMAHSIEGRFPFLDHNLVELSRKIPSNFKIYKGEQKHILKEVAKKYIAPSCLSMNKKGFNLPLKQWMEGPLSLLVVRHLDSLKQRDEMNSETIEKWYFQYKKGRINASRIWHLVALEMWFESFIDNQNQSVQG
jgi:asparagine synthase (glutamine-hydrolysing)